MPGGPSVVGEPSVGGGSSVTGGPSESGGPSVVVPPKCTGEEVIIEAEPRQPLIGQSDINHEYETRQLFQNSETSRKLRARKPVNYRC